MSGVYRKACPDEAFDSEDDGALPVELRRVAEAELSETPEKRREALTKLTQLLQDEQDLNANKDAQFLLRFLRVRKYNVDAALRTVRNYYKNRASCPSLYDTFLPHTAPPQGRKLVMVLPDKDVHGRPVLLCKPGKSHEQDLNANKDAQFLLRFLRVRKYNVDAALRTVRNYYKNRASCPSLYDTFLPHTAPPQGRKLVMVLPDKDVHGRPVLLCKPGKSRAWITGELSYEDFHRTWLLCMEHLASDPAAQVVGVALLLDYAGFTPDKVLSLRPGLLRRAVEYVQDCMPMRMKAAHIVRQHYAFDMLFAIIRPFVKAKLAERVHLHGSNFEKLHEHISPGNLPAEYGGQGPPLDHDNYWKQVDDEEERFAAANRFGYASKSRDDPPDGTEEQQEFTSL
ncbi:hypothetical protein HPB50_014734 [Hyalomma asiaticum]|uniref:Uncharacterized protein n=1 Tax=Hyalomma asiaticum TaxID=266040 RepID=A0ACB7S6R7_HYAAI|nr:hypothetical protein HPB50_014734 [Hyalomma asiaticum]